MHIYRQKPMHYFTLPRDDNFQVSDGVYLRKYEPFQFFLDEDPMQEPPPPPPFNSALYCVLILR